MCHVPKVPGNRDKKKESNPGTPADHRPMGGEIVDVIRESIPWSGRNARGRPAESFPLAA